MTNFPIAEAYLERNVARGGFDVHVVGVKHHGGVDMVLPIGPLTLESVPHTTYRPPQPTFHLSMDSAQALLDGLWRAGFRPTSGQAVAENGNLAIELLREHLADMRRLVFPATPGPDMPQLVIDHI